MIEKKQINDKELRAIQLAILRTVADFCDAHDIKYWLDFGTLIGAVRHKDYIPWDDDIDIGMLREDYDRFMRLFNAENERYKFCSYETDKKFYFPFGKVLDTETVLYEPDRRGAKLAVNIDIFPYDNAPAPHSVKVARMFKTRDRCNIGEVAKRHHGKVRGGMLRRLAVACLRLWVRLFPRDRYVKKIVKNAKKYAGKVTGYVADFSGSQTYFVCDKSLFTAFTDGTFAGSTYKIPQEYDAVLRMTYGDYMQLPPEEQRVSHHKYEAYYLGHTEETKV